MKICIRFGIFIFFLGLISPAFLSAQNEENKNKILIISSYTPVKETGNHVISAFIRQLKQKTDVTFAVEYMDSESSSDYNQWLQWQTSLFKAYEQHPAIVVIIGGEAWSVYRNCCPPGWLDIPVVLGGVKQSYIDYRKEMEENGYAGSEIIPMENTFDGFKITGYYITDYFCENIELVKRLQPEITDIAFCYGNRYHHILFKNYVSGIVRDIEDVRVHFWFGDRLSTTALVDSILQMTDKCAVISAGWFTDINHYPHAYSMLHNRLSAYPEINLYEILDQDFSNPNYFGGYFVSGIEIGTDLAGLTDLVLKKGIENSPSFSETPSSPKYHLNYPTFKNAGLNEAFVPDNVVWHNIEPGFWEKYKLRIIFLIIFSFGLLALFYWVRRKKEQMYKRSNEELKQLLLEMPSMAVVFDTDLRITEIVNPMDSLLYGLPIKQYIGRNMKEIGQMVPGFQEGVRQIENYLKKTALTRESCSFNYETLVTGNKRYVEAKTAPLGEKRVICFVHDITSLIFAEKEVAKYKSFLNLVIDNLPVGIFVKDVSDDFRYIYYNRKVAEFSGDHAAKYLGKNDFELNDPLAEEHAEQDREVLKSETPLTYERMVDCKHLGIRYGITTKTKLVNYDGSCYIIAIVVDVTDIRKNEIELNNIRQGLSVALEVGALSAWIYEVENDRFTSLYREVLVGQDKKLKETEEVFHPDDREKYRLLMEDLISGKCEKKREVLRTMKEGEYASYEIKAIGIRSKDNGRVFQIIGTEKDITVQLREQSKLEASNFKTELAISSNGIVQWDYDVEKEIFSSPNPASYMYHGISKADFIALVHDDDLPVFIKALDDVVSEKVVTVNIQIRVCMPQVGFRWVDIHAVIFEKNEQGRVTQLTGLRKDVTEWKNLTEELIILRDKADESNRLKSAFLANMSHEIRTPLNAIVGFSNLVTETTDLVERQEYCKIIETNNELLLQLVNDILDLSKIEAGQLDFVFTETSLRSIFANLEQIYRMKVKEGVQLICELPDEDHIIHSEKNRLTQVISNFLNNACKFTTAGSIKIGYEQTPEGLRFFVSDTGKGIAKENLPHVFERFRKFDNFVQGTGLGLSICQTIVQRLEGEIGVESEIGKGSTFWFIIPYTPGTIETETNASGQTAGNRQNKKTDTEQKLLLVAEDNDSNFLLLYNILKNKYRIERALNGRDAVTLNAELHPDLILMDVRMPIMDGLEATRNIRKEDPETPIIILTANAFDDDKKQAIKAGGNDYLAKPLNAARLNELLDKYL